MVFSSNKVLLRILAFNAGKDRTSFFLQIQKNSTVQPEYRVLEKWQVANMKLENKKFTSNLSLRKQKKA